MKTRYFIKANSGSNFAARFAISGTKKMHRARTGTPKRITAIFKNNVVTFSIKSTSPIYSDFDFNIHFIVFQ
jgi:uncharacterized protein (UPF0333 family)